MTSKSTNIFLAGFLILQLTLLVLFLDNTYTDGWNLRQAQTAMMARNIASDGIEFLPTRLDFFAPREGNVILEFPLLHGLTALTYRIFGENEVNGRLLVLVFHILNIGLMFLILSRLFNSAIAKIFTFLYGFTPIIFYSAHAFIPETSMLSFYLLAFYLFILNSHRLSGQVGYRVVLSIGPLLKPLAGVIYFPILFDSMSKGIKGFSREVILLGLCSLPFVFWMVFGYFTNSSEASTGSDWANWTDILLGRGGIIGNWINPEFYSNVAFNLVFLNATPLVICFAGLAIATKTHFKYRKFVNAWAIANVVFLFVFAGANRGHPYYQIYFVPIILIYAAAYFDKLVKGKSEFKRRGLLIATLLTHVLISLAVFFYGVDDTRRINNLQEFQRVADLHFNQVAKTTDAFVLMQTENMTSGVYDYYLNQYTQQFSLKHHSSPVLHLEQQVTEGAKFLFMVNTSYGNSIDISKNSQDYWHWLDSNTTKLYQSESMILFKLQ